MIKHIWKPNTTVAAIIERDNKFLLVEEITERGNRFNQPAGHLEDNETLIQAVIRETMEEAAYEFTPEFLLGVYQWKHTLNDTTYLRFAFIGKAGVHYPMQELDEGIVQVVWMDPRWRSSTARCGRWARPASRCRCACCRACR